MTDEQWDEIETLPIEQQIDIIKYAVRLCMNNKTALDFMDSPRCVAWIKKNVKVINANRERTL